MIKRCIMIFPEFVNGQIIDEMREKYDSLAEHVRPHITLVFPFESDIGTDQLRDHISSAVAGIRPFEIILKGITPNDEFGRHLFLNIQTGKDCIIELHRNLYTGILEKHYPGWLRGHTYLPHTTVGSFGNAEDFKAAISETMDIAESFQTTVNRISVEIIDENEDSIIEMEVSLE